jgi:hypothetical protein
MKEVIIRIQIPDGVDVQVSQGQGGGGDQRPFVARPTPPEPDYPCPIHGTGWRLVPAGQSKKPPFRQYNAFWVCSEPGCNERGYAHGGSQEEQYQ